MDSIGEAERIGAGVPTRKESEDSEAPGEVSIERNEVITEIGLPPLSKSFAQEAERFGILSSLPPQLRMPIPRHLAQLFDYDFDVSIASSDVWSRCSVVVGMHPDEATEPLIDMCLKHNKAFAIVPCCVFAESNPQRINRDGSLVRKYEEFCDFLQRKDSRIQRDLLLDMPGRNIVLYFFGSV
mmetsp:Transcript_49091/g.76560  ORF Transcript_49091/g.76560 Transcript_49091/m.76560 type:complete len:183 (-) Transcript_49091:22-570(-)